MSSPGYCELYINTDVSISRLTDAIIEATEGSLTNNYVEFPLGNVYVVVNTPSGCREDEFAFLQYRYLLEVNPLADNASSHYISEVRNLINHLKLIASDVVAACEFEDQLSV